MSLNTQQIVDQHVQAMEQPDILGRDRGLRGQGHDLQHLGRLRCVEIGGEDQDFLVPIPCDQRALLWFEDINPLMKGHHASVGKQRAPAPPYKLPLILLFARRSFVSAPHVVGLSPLPKVDPVASRFTFFLSYSKIE
jgi:hypothetical protein